MTRVLFILALISALVMGLSDHARAQSGPVPSGVRLGVTRVADFQQGNVIIPQERASDESSTGRQKQHAPLRAAFVVNFVSFTTWPDEVFEDDNAPLIITIVNDRELARQVAGLTADKPVNGRRALVFHLVSPEAGSRSEDDDAQQAFLTHLRRSHAVYLSEVLPDDHLRRALAAVRRRPILTISPADEFAETGGMLGLVIRKDRLTFDANVTRIEESRLKVSSKVLRLARIIRDNGETRGGT